MSAPPHWELQVTSPASQDVGAGEAVDVVTDSGAGGDVDEDADEHEDEASQRGQNDNLGSRGVSLYIPGCLRLAKGREDSLHCRTMRLPGRLSEDLLLRRSGAAQRNLLWRVRVEVLEHRGMVPLLPPVASVSDSDFDSDSDSNAGTGSVVQSPATDSEPIISPDDEGIASW